MDCSRGCHLEVPVPHSMDRTGKAKTLFVFGEWGRDDGPCGTTGGPLLGGLLQSHRSLSPPLKGSRSPWPPGQRSSPAAPRPPPSGPHLEPGSSALPEGRPVAPWCLGRGIDEPGDQTCGSGAELPGPALAHLQPLMNGNSIRALVLERQLF